MNTLNATGEPDIPEWTTRRGASDPIAPAPAHVAAQRSGCPISKVRIWDGSTPWLVTRHADYRTVTSHPSFSADRDRQGYPLKNAGYQSKEKSFLTMDDPEHLPYRRLWSKNLSARQMEDLRPEIHRIVDTAIDDMLAGPNPTDFISAFALRVPAEIIGALFGVPADDRTAFLDLASTMSSAASSVEDTRAAWTRLQDYAERLVAAREASPRDDVVTRFLARSWSGS